MIMNEKLIREIRLGRAAVKNNGNSEDMKSIIKHAFPNDFTTLGTAAFYVAAHDHGSDYWKALDNEPKNKKIIFADQIINSGEQNT